MAGYLSDLKSAQPYGREFLTNYLESPQQKWRRIVVSGMWFADRRFRAGVAVGEAPVLGSLAYLAIFGASLAGLASLGAWAIAVTAIALASVSRARHFALYEQGREMGLKRIIDAAMLRSFGNALIAASIAYAAGCLLRVL